MTKSAQPLSVYLPKRYGSRRQPRRNVGDITSRIVRRDLVYARHILFQVTPGARVRARAERTLADLLQTPERFDAVARELFNCPSGQEGGNLGQIGRGDTVMTEGCPERRCRSEAVQEQIG